MDVFLLGVANNTVCPRNSLFKSKFLHRVLARQNFRYVVMAISKSLRTEFFPQQIHILLNIELRVVAFV